MSLLQERRGNQGSGDAVDGSPSRKNMQVSKKSGPTANLDSSLLADAEEPEKEESLFTAIVADAKVTRKPKDRYIKKRPSKRRKTRKPILYTH